MNDGPDFFISYTVADEQWATWIAWHLEAAGYSTVIQAWDFRPGSNFVVEMDEAAGAAQRTLVVLSPRFIASRFTKPEWAAAFAKDPTGALRTVLPVLVEATETQGLLDQIVHIDLTGLSRDEAAAKLIAGLEPGRSKPSAEPAFPGAAAKTTMAAGATPPTRHALSRGLEWAPAARELASQSRDEVLPSGWPRSGPATLEISLIPAEPQALRVAQLEHLCGEMTAAGRNTGLFSQSLAVESAHTATSAFARNSRERYAEETGILITRTGQRTAWVTLPHDSLGSVVDAQQVRHRIGSLLQLLALVDAPLANRYGFTARIAPLLSVIVGDAHVVGNRSSASMRGFGRPDPFPLAMPDTVRGGAIAENADELAAEVVARIVAALR